MGLRMDFKWTEEDHRRYSVIFSQARLWPAPGPGYFTTDKWKLWANLGLLGLSVPEAYGGEQLRREVLLRLSSGEWIGANAIAEEGVGSVVYAVTQPDLGYLGMSAFVVERATPGLTIGEPFGKLGLDRCPADTLWFDRCVVPVRWRLGAEGQGTGIFQDAIGRAIGSNQAISHRIARMRMCLESARLLLWRACWLLEQNEPARTEVAMAKLVISECTSN